MLVIARKVGQTVLLGEEIEVTVSSIRGDQVRLAIKAPREVSIYRKEAVEQVELGNTAAVDSATGLMDLLRALPDAGSAGAVPSSPESVPSSPEREPQ
jgi:carbon storage regulator